MCTVVVPTADVGAVEEATHIASLVVRPPSAVGIVVVVAVSVAVVARSVVMGWDRAAAIGVPRDEAFVLERTARGGSARTRRPAQTGC